MREIFISWQDQLELMEFIACASGHVDYESTRSEMWDALYEQYGRDHTFTLEKIPSEDLDVFIDWLENPEG